MTHLIPVGNSLGIRIPKAIIIQVGFKEEMELELKVVEEGLLIAPVHPSRKGWAEAFKEGKKEDLLMGDKITNKFDEEEWEW